MTPLLTRLVLAVAALALLATLAIAIARSDLPEERAGNQEPSAVQRVEPPRGGSG